MNTLTPLENYAITYFLKKLKQNIGITVQANELVTTICNEDIEYSSITYNTQKSIDLIHKYWKDIKSLIFENPFFRNVVVEDLFSNPQMFLCHCVIYTIINLLPYSDDNKNMIIITPKYIKALENTF